MLLNLLIKPFWVLVVDREVQLDVGNASYGLFIAMYSFTLWFNVVLDMGIKNYHNTLLARNHGQLSSDYASYIPLKAVLSALYALVMVLAAYLTGEYLKHPVLFGCLVLNQVIISFTLFFRASVTGLGKYKTDSWLSIIDRVVMLFMAIPIFFTQSLEQFRTIEVFIIIHTIGYFATGFVAFLFVRKHLSRFRWQFDPTAWRKVVRNTLPFALFTMLMTIYVRADFVMVERLLDDGAEKAGIYAKGYRLLEAGSMFALLFGNLLLPVFSAIQAQREELIRIIRAAFQIIVIPALVAVTACFFFRAELMNAYYPDCTQETIDAFGLLMLNFISVCLFYIFSTVLTAAHRVRELNIFAAIGLAINIVLNLILIPRFGIYGAIAATLATQGAVSLIQTGQVIKLYSIKLSTGIIVKFSLWLMGLIGLYHGLKMVEFGWIWQLGLYTSISFTFALVFRLIDAGQLLKIIKETRNDGIASEG